MSEFEDFSELSNVFSDFEKAMEDTNVTAAGRQAADRSHAMSEEEAAALNQTDANTIELDALVDHAIDSGADISGQVRLFSRGADSAPVVAQDAYGSFKGFIISRRGGRIEYDYVFAGFTNGDGTILSRTEYHELTAAGEGDQIRTDSLLARPGDVYMNFDYVHPVRAFAWLTVSHPEIIEALDQLLIDGEGTDADKLLALKDFSFLLPNDLSEQETQMLMRSMTEYVRGLASIDYEVPYNMVVDGLAIRLQDASNSEKKKMLLKRRALFSVNYIDAYTEDVLNEEKDQVTGMKCAFGLFGKMYSSELDGATYTMLVPLSSIESLSSQRLEDRRRAAKLASGETA